jgi:tetratricopeptide (TPR) repeat protein
MKAGMKKDKKRVAAKPVAPVARTGPPQWQMWAAWAAGLVAMLWAYAPAMDGPFLFDDAFLPFTVSGLAQRTLAQWLHSPRPLLMATYWMSARLSPDDTWWFHFMNVAIHAIASGLAFFIVRRLLQWAAVEESKRNLLAGVAAALFLLHPVQSEAVAYLAGRSESLSVMLALAAFTVFLYRRRAAAAWGTAAAVFVLFLAALASKEQTMALPALFLLTDYWFNDFSFRGIRANWRIYAPMAAAGLAGVWFFRGLITNATTAGFGLKEFTWYQYFFTQCRALWVYIGLFLFPVNLSADWDFAISRTVLDKGAIAGLVALVAAAAAAWHWRRRFPLACYGYFAFLLLMAPTSSILPIKDPVAERRLYFAMLGLLLILVDALARLRVERKALAVGAAVLVAAATLATHARAEVWSDAVMLWRDTVSKSPNKWRAHFQLGYAYFSLSGYPKVSEPEQCELALQEYGKSAGLHPADADLLADWGLAYDCLNEQDEAMAKLRQSALLKPTGHVFSQIAMIYGKKEQWRDALANLAAAEKLDPAFPDTYVYRGKVYFRLGQYTLAAREYQHALALDPSIQDARNDLNLVFRQLQGNPGR